jgi:hypothetical protein
MNSVGVSTAPCGRRRWHVHREAFVLDTTHSYTTLFALSPLAFIWWRCEFYRWNWRNPVAPRIATRVKLRILFRIWARACCMAGIGKEDGLPGRQRCGCSHVEQHRLVLALAASVS